jgi:hypothetical protein
MRRKVGAVVVLLALAVASAGAIAANGGGASQAAKKKPAIKYEAADLFIETNATDGDIGLQLFLDGDAWDTFKLLDPKGREVIQTADTKGRLHGWGLTEYFWETDEPEFSEVPLRKFKKRFPKGKYTFKGRDVDGRRLVGFDKLSHVMPAGPVITSPTRGEQVNPNSFKVTWEPVTNPTGVQIVRYQVIVVQGPVERVTLNLEPSVTSVDIPSQALVSGEANVEVLAKERSGNQTISEVSFAVK